MKTIWHDMRYGVRIVRRNPGFTILAVIILALGVEADTCASATSDVTSKSSLPVADSNQAPLEEADTSGVENSGPEDEKVSRLVAWWKLDEIDGNIAADSSGNGLAGGLIGNPQWEPAAGKIEGALAFRGAQDAVLINSEAAFDIMNAITVAAWIKVDSFDKRWQTIVAKGDTAWRLQRTAGEDTLAFHCTGLNSVKGQWPHGIEGRKSVNDGKWHHVAGVYDGAVIFLYIDGALDNSSRASGTIRTNDFPVSIGSNTETSDRNWNGLIDEVSVFACALEAGGISALYSGADPAITAEQASYIVSAEDVGAEEPAEQVNYTFTSQPEKKKSGKWPLVAAIFVGIVLTAGVYLQRRKHTS